MTKRRTPKQDRAKQKVEAIMRAAQELLATEGITAFNTNRIAKEAGVGVGSLYEYFPNKSAIAERLLDHLDARETEAVLGAFTQLQHASLSETIRGLVETAFGLYREHARLYQSLRMIAGVQRRREGIRPVEESIVAAIKETLLLHRDAIQREDIDFAAVTTFYTVEALAFASATHQPHDKTDDDWIDEISAVVQGYLTLPS